MSGSIYQMALVVLVALLAPTPLLADDNRPLTVVVEQREPDGYDVTWKVPPNLFAAVVPRLVPPAGCTPGQTRHWSDALGFWAATRWQCEAALAGADIGIEWPRDAPPLATIARMRQLDGSETTLLAQAGERVVRIAARPEHGNLFRRFLWLGVKHIMIGLDHLLFVACLILVAGTLQRTAVTITGFTLAHSLTLGLAALDLVSVPVKAVEALIALSIVFLAVEIAKGPRGTLTWRQPVFVAIAFGLLHGFGFASVLREIGLPQQGLVSALLAFNLGIEAGQLVFALGAFLLFRLLRMLVEALATRDAAVARRFGAYAVGVIASYWLLDRLV